MTGYIIASILTELSNHRTTCFGILCWRWSFLIEIILLTPLYLGLYLIPKEDIQVCVVKKLAGSGGKGSVGTASGSSRDIVSGTAAFIGSASRRNITGDIEAPIPHRVVKPRGDAAVYDSPSGAVSVRPTGHVLYNVFMLLLMGSVYRNLIFVYLYIFFYMYTWNLIDVTITLPYRRDASTARSLLTSDGNAVVCAKQR